MSSSPTADVPDSVQVVVGRAGRAHGVSGELSVTVLTDEPALRFGVDAALVAGLPAGGTRSLTVAAARPHGERLLVRFAGVPDRTAAEALAGATLVADAVPDESTDDPAEFFDHQLVGAAAVDPAGAVLGSVTDVLHHGAQDLLVVAPAGGGDDVLVPFVAAIATAVDVPGRRITLDPPGGLFPQLGGGAPGAAPGGAPEATA